MTELHGSGGVLDEAREAADKKIWMTLSGLPLTIRLEWPFHPATSGADFWVLHGDIRLVGSDELHAPVAVNLSQTVREVMPSLELQSVETPVINVLRKEVDRRQIEFLKSGKLLPVPFSSRHYDFKRQQWVFGKATDEAMAEFVERKVYWGTKLALVSEESQSPLIVKDARNGAPGEQEKSPPPPSRQEREKCGVPGRVWIGDPADAQYLQTTTAHLLQVAVRLAEQGLLRIDSEWAKATPELMNQAERFENARRAAVEELEKKHAFERG